MFDPDAFTTDFELPDEEPEPEEDPENGPWISHGTIHLGFKPRH